MWKMKNPVMLEERARKILAEFLQNIDNNDFVWMDEIVEEAKKIFTSGASDELELMPKTPSQKSHRKKKRISSVKNHFATKRISRRENTQLFSKRITRSRKNLEINVENASPCFRVTASQTASSARVSDAPLKKLSFNLADDRLPLVAISPNERCIAELQAKKAPPQTDTVDLTLKLSEEGSPIKRSPLTKTCLVVKETPEAEIKEGRGICKMKIAKVPNAAEKEESNTQEKLCVQNQEESWASESEAAQKLNQSSQAPTTSKANCRSVRLSLLGRTSMHSRASLAERYSLSAKRERMIQKSIQKSLSKRRTSQKSLSASCHVAVAEEITESGLMIEPASQKVDENPRMSLRSHKANVQAVIKPVEQDGDDKGGNSEKSDDVQKQPQSARRKPSYKRAVYEQDVGQHSEEDYSPARKRTVSPQCPASKVVRPFKTFLHTVHKNRMLMMTPGSSSRSATMKSFIKQNTPIQATPQRGFVQKERERLENKRKREEAEQLRRQKLEEGKKQRLEEIKRKREDRLRKVLQARERVEQMEEEKRRRLEQKLAQHEEKNEKVREEKLAEDKVKKKVAAKKLEELEARRKQEDDARKKRVLQLEEERRQKEQMQKKREEEEQEKARKIAEQHQLELEREKKLSAERELEKRKEQERLQAQREHEQKEKEKAVRLHKEVLAAAKEKERLRKDLEEKERKLQEQRQQEEKQEKAASETEAKASSKQLNKTVVIENSTSCNSYPMTPQGPKQPKIDVNNYGMDLNSDDSTDDESQPRKAIPAWATGNLLSQAIIHQYYKPVDTTALFGVVKSPKLEEIFKKSKPRYFKRTSSAVWNSPPFPGGRNVPYALKI
ncbi:inner centromere protein [Lacerta agilis]|uniref:inner centromere protein n=1 Tax=Lacerta agilis TaxID=80427 RepID=UPI0014199D93|nr:inner centromere protein [Lacerta agilis]